jgi:hypothetical protein
MAIDKVDIENVKLKLNTGTKRLIEIGAVVVAITSIAGAYSFYVNNIWKPVVKVNSVDFASGIAEITLTKMFGIKKVISIYGNANFNVGGDWGIRFGSSSLNNTSIYDRLELTKKDMVVEYLESAGTAIKS